MTALLSMLAVCLAVILPPAAFAASVTLAWDANTESDLAGYIVYYGTASRNYTSNIDVGNTTQYTTPDLPDGVTYYFAVKAYNEADDESDYSAELAHTVGSSNQDPTTPGTPNGPSSGYTDTSYTFSTSASDPDGDSLEYQFDWGNGTSSSWGAASRSHAWSSAGAFCIRARVRDSHGALSGWSGCQNITIAVPSYTITATAGENGSISPAGTVTVNRGSSITFNMNPDSNYQVLNVSIDGDSVGTATRYTFENVTTDHTISASFTEIGQTGPSADSDNDGVPDNRDDFPNDPNETVDTDSDGTGNNADTDDDNDGMPDDWEIRYGLNPLSDDAALDPDNDGISNLYEYLGGTEPYLFDEFVRPATPVLLSPSDSEIVSLTPTLQTAAFSDADPSDMHTSSRWQIVRSEDQFLVFDKTSSASLTELVVPGQVLDEITSYDWRVQFADNHGLFSDWSDSATFRTGYNVADADGNGIPDHQEVASTIDLNDDGIPDNNQNHIKSVNVEGESTQIGISIPDAEPILSIVSLEAEYRVDILNEAHFIDQASEFPYGLISFKLAVSRPGDEVVVILHLSIAASPDGTWYKYDPVDDVWYDYSGHTEFSADRKRIYLTLKDGGFGDADGIENGIIVDPLGFSAPTSLLAAAADAADDGGGGGSGGGGGCFISATDGNQKANELDGAGHNRIALLVALSLLALIFFLVQCLRKFPSI